MKIGEGKSLELGEAKVDTEENRADYGQYYINKVEENDSVGANRVYHVSETDNEASIPPS